MEPRYLLDNNVLVALSARQRASSLVRTSCRIPSEVLYEARGLADADELHALEYPMTARVLTLVSEILSTVPSDDYSIVDLYRNRGTADPILIACALEAIEQAAETLFPEEWTIVSEDTAVVACARRFNIAVEGSKTFASRC